MKAYGGVDVYIHIFLTSALAGGEWSDSRSGRYIPGEIAHSLNRLRYPDSSFCIVKMKIYDSCTSPFT
jgi:hypothetical protein